MRATAAILPGILMLAAAGTALATPVRPIICAPPLNTPLRLIVTQHMWLADGRTATATVTRTLRFVQDGDGTMVHASIAALDTDQPDAASPKSRKGEHRVSARDRMTLAYGAPGEVRTIVRLDASMAVRSIDSLDALWRDFRRRQARLDSAMAHKGKANLRTDAMLRMLDAMGDAQKLAILTGFIAPVVRHCGTMEPVGTVITPDGSLIIESRAESGGVGEWSRYSVDGGTGLLGTLERRIVTADAPLQPLRETWVLQPE